MVCTLPPGSGTGPPLLLDARKLPSRRFFCRCLLIMIGKRSCPLQTRRTFHGRSITMTRIARWVLLPTLLVGWLLAAGSVTAAVPEIKDDGKFFSAEAIKKANDIIREIHDLDPRDHKDLFIETYATVPGGATKAEELKKSKEARDEYFAKWGQARERELRVDGVYVIITRNPAHIEVGVGKETAKKAFTREDKRELQRTLLERFKKKEYNEGLIQAAE